VSRYHLAISALREVSKKNTSIGLDANLLIANYLSKLKELDDYVLKWGKDPDYLNSDIHKFREHLKKMGPSSM
jgi:hypothetical protein